MVDPPSGIAYYLPKRSNKYTALYLSAILLLNMTHYKLVCIAFLYLLVCILPCLPLLLFRFHCLCLYLLQTNCSMEIINSKLSGFGILCMDFKDTF